MAEHHPAAAGEAFPRRKQRGDCQTSDWSSRFDRPRKGTRSSSNIACIGVSQFNAHPAHRSRDIARSAGRTRKRS
jgi:hypothetical protein